MIRSGDKKHAPEDQGDLWGRVIAKRRRDCEALEPNDVEEIVKEHWATNPSAPSAIQNPVEKLEWLLSQLMATAGKAPSELSSPARRRALTDLKNLLQEIEDGVKMKTKANISAVALSGRSNESSRSPTAPSSDTRPMEVINSSLGLTSRVPTNADNPSGHVNAQLPAMGAPARPVSQSQSSANRLQGSQLGVSRIESVGQEAPFGVENQNPPTMVPKRSSQSEGKTHDANHLRESHATRPGTMEMPLDSTTWNAANSHPTTNLKPGKRNPTSPGRNSPPSLLHGQMSTDSGIASAAMNEGAHQFRVGQTASRWDPTSHLNSERRFNSQHDRLRSEQPRGVDNPVHGGYNAPPKPHMFARTTPRPPSSWPSPPVNSRPPNTLEHPDRPVYGHGFPSRVNNDRRNGNALLERPQENQWNQPLSHTDQYLRQDDSRSQSREPAAGRSLEDIQPNRSRWEPPVNGTNVLLSSLSRVSENSAVSGSNQAAPRSDLPRREKLHSLNSEDLRQPDLPQGGSSHGSQTAASNSRSGAGSRSQRSTSAANRATETHPVGMPGSWQGNEEQSMVRAAAATSTIQGQSTTPANQELVTAPGPQGVNQSVATKINGHSTTQPKPSTARAAPSTTLQEPTLSAVGKPASQGLNGGDSLGKPLNTQQRPNPSKLQLSNSQQAMPLLLEDSSKSSQPSGTIPKSGIPMSTESRVRSSECVSRGHESVQNMSHEATTGSQDNTGRTSQFVSTGGNSNAIIQPNLHTRNLTASGFPNTTKETTMQSSTTTLHLTSGGENGNLIESPPGQLIHPPDTNFQESLRSTQPKPMNQAPSARTTSSGTQKTEKFSAIGDSSKHSFAGAVIVREKMTTITHEDADIPIILVKDVIDRLTEWDPFWKQEAVVKIRMTNPICKTEPNTDLIKTATTFEIDLTNPQTTSHVFMNAMPGLNWGQKKSWKTGDSALILRMLPLSPTRKRADCHLWPKGTFLQIKGKPVTITQRRQQAHDRTEWKGMCHLLDIAEHITNPSEMFKIQICCYDVEEYAAVIALCKYRSSEDLFDTLETGKPLLKDKNLVRLHPHESLQQARVFAARPIALLDEEDNDTSDIGKFVFSLKCPIAQLMMQCPVRGKTCTKHFQCFDLKSYIASNEFVSGNRWRCASCENFVSLESLVYCGFTAGLLHEFAETASPQRDRVELRSDDSYRLLEARGRRYAKRDEEDRSQAGNQAPKRARSDNNDVIVL